MAGETTTIKVGDSTPLKTVAVVLGALAFGWAAIELAFKPLFAKGGKDKSEPSPAADAVDAVETKAKEVVEEVENAAADAGVSSA